MALKKVWCEELHDWVYDDPDILKDLDFDDLGLDKIDLSDCNLMKGSFPLSMLEHMHRSVQ